MKAEAKIISTTVRIWFSGETLHAEAVSEGLYEIHNIPLTIPGISHADIVCARPWASGEEGFGGSTLKYVGVYRKSGNRTMVININPKAPALMSAAYNTFLDEIQSLGCGYEDDGEKLLAVNIPADASLETVAGLILIVSKAGHKYTLTDDGKFRQER